jgi:hypothetical protein
MEPIYNHFKYVLYMLYGIYYVLFFVINNNLLFYIIYNLWVK